MRDLRMNRAGALVAGLASVMAGAAAAAGVDRFDRDPPKHLESFLVAGATLAAATDRARIIFNRSDTDGDGVLTIADGRLTDAVVRTKVQADGFKDVLQFDLDRDGVVTEAEIRTILAFEKRVAGQRVPLTGSNPAAFDERVRSLMAADGDHDGRITLQEVHTAARNAIEATKSIAGTETIFAELLDYAGAPTGLSEQAFIDLVAERMKEIDTDGDGKLSHDEVVASTQRRKERQRVAAAALRQKEQELAARDAAAEAARTCDLPKPTPDAEVLLLSAYESQALSSTAIGTREVAVGHGIVDVAPGAGPIWLTLLTHKPVIWRFTGAVDRIERAIVSSSATAGEKDDATLAGAIGLPADRITFLPRCLQAFTDAHSVDGAKTIAAVRRQADRDPKVAAAYAVSKFLVPSAGLDVMARGGKSTIVVASPTQVHKSFGGRLFDVTDMPLAKQLEFAYPGGIVAVDPATVVASRPVFAYDVLPGLAGIAQLLKEGALERNDVGEFVIRRKIRLPGGMYGAHSARFLLLKGVPVPDGTAGHSCIFSEETAEPIPGSDSCR